MIQQGANRDLRKKEQDQEDEVPKFDRSKLAAGVRKAQLIYNKFQRQMVVMKKVHSRIPMRVPEKAIPDTKWISCMDEIAQRMASAASDDAANGNTSKAKMLQLLKARNVSFEEDATTNWFGPNYTGYEQITYDQYEYLVQQSLAQDALKGELRQARVRLRTVRIIKGAIVAIGVTTIVGLGVSALTGSATLGFMPDGSLNKIGWYTVFVLWPSLTKAEKEGWKGFKREFMKRALTDGVMRELTVVAYLYPPPIPGMYEGWSRWGARMTATGVEMSCKNILSGVFDAAFNANVTSEDSAVLNRMAQEAAKQQQKSKWIENRLRSGEPLKKIMKPAGNSPASDLEKKAFARTIGAPFRWMKNTKVGRTLVTVIVALSSVLTYTGTWSKLRAIWMLPKVQQFVGDTFVEPGAKMVQSILIPRFAKWILADKLAIPTRVSQALQYIESRFNLESVTLRDQIPIIDELCQAVEYFIGEEVKWNMSVCSAASLVLSNIITLAGSDVLVPLADPKRARWYYDHWDTTSTINGLTDVFKSMTGQGDIMELLSNPLGTALPWLYNHVSVLNTGDVVLDDQGIQLYTITEVDNISGVVKVLDQKSAEITFDLDDGNIFDTMYLRNPDTHLLVPIRVGRLRATGLAEAFQTNGEPIPQATIDHMVQYHAKEVDTILKLAEKTRDAQRTLARIESKLTSDRETFVTSYSLMEAASIPETDQAVMSWKSSVDNVLVSRMMKGAAPVLNNIATSNIPIEDKVRNMEQVCGGFTPEFRQYITTEMQVNPTVDYSIHALQNGRYFKTYSRTLASKLAKGLVDWKTKVVDTHLDEWNPTMPDVRVGPSSLDQFLRAQDSSSPVFKHLKEHMDTSQFNDILIRTSEERREAAISEWMRYTKDALGVDPRTDIVGKIRLEIRKSMLSSADLLSTEATNIKLRTMFSEILKNPDGLALQNNDLLNPLGSEDLSDAHASQLISSMNELKWLTNSTIDSSVAQAVAELKTTMRDNGSTSAFTKLQTLMNKEEMQSASDLFLEINAIEKSLDEQVRTPTVYGVADMAIDRGVTFKQAIPLYEKEKGTSILWRIFLGYPDTQTAIEDVMVPDDLELTMKIIGMRQKYAAFTEQVEQLVGNVEEPIVRRRVGLAKLATSIQQSEKMIAETKQLLEKSDWTFSQLADAMLGIKEGRGIDASKLNSLVSESQKLEKLTTQQTETNSRSLAASSQDLITRSQSVNMASNKVASADFVKADLNSKLNKLREMGVSKTALVHTAQLASFAQATKQSTKCLDAMANLLGMLSNAFGGNGTGVLDKSMVATINELSAEFDKAKDKLMGLLQAVNPDVAKCFDAFTYDKATGQTNPPGYEHCLNRALVGSPLNSLVEYSIQTAKAGAFGSSSLAKGFWGLALSALATASAFAIEGYLATIDLLGIANVDKFFRTLDDSAASPELKAGSSMAILMAAIRCTKEDRPLACVSSAQLSEGALDGKVTAYWTWVDLLGTAPELITESFVRDVTSVSSGGSAWSDRLEALKAISRILTQSASPFVDTLLFGSKQSSTLRTHYETYKIHMAKSTSSHLRNITSGLTLMTGGDVDKSMIESVVQKWNLFMEFVQADEWVTS